MMSRLSRGVLVSTVIEKGWPAVGTDESAPKVVDGESEVVVDIINVVVA